MHYTRFREMFVDIELLLGRPYGAQVDFRSPYMVGHKSAISLY